LGLRICLPLSTAFLIAAIIGQGVRDRTFVTALLMYIPIVHVAAISLLLQIHSRASLRAIGFTAVVLTLGSIQMLGLKSTVPATQPTIKLVQWNVLWGGFHRSSTWPAIISRLRDASADIILLTEPPPGELLEQMRASLGESWKIAQVGRAPHERYATDLVIASRYDVIVEDTVKTPDARMICARIAFPSQVVRVLLVDGMSNPPLSRTPRLRAIKEYVEARAAKNEPVDIIAGDFNTLGTCIGFDDFSTMAGGFDRASEYSHGWRATWPMILPAWEIDHVFVSKRFGVASCEVFSTLQSDHRGQTVEITPLSASSTQIIGTADGRR
jgi:endonuclease/exonuclease/phosphatase family metal-dependent hydrolase